MCHDEEGTGRGPGERHEAGYGGDHLCGWYLPSAGDDVAITIPLYNVIVCNQVCHIQDFYKQAKTEDFLFFKIGSKGEFFLK